jgi:ubiquinone/menaquinone biosynthesis C-methylase UbiE
MSLSDPKLWNDTVQDYGESSDDVTLAFGILSLPLCRLDEQIRNGMKLSILDVAAGPASLAMHISKIAIEFKAPIHMVSTDFSSGMIAIAEKKLVSKELQEMNAVIVMDGQNLAFSDEKFDYCFSIFGVMMFNDRVKGLKEFHRVLKKGGTCVVSGWKKSVTTSMNTIIKDMGISLEPYKVGSFGDEKIMKSELNQADFMDVSTYEIIHESRFESFDSLMKFLITNPFFQEQWAKLNESPEIFSVFKKMIIEKFTVSHEKHLNISIAALIGIATK